MIENKTALLCLDPHTPGSGPETTVASVEFSYYDRPVSNTIPSKEMTIWDAYQDIRGERNRFRTELLRGITDKAVARNYKARSFDYVTFSGVFSKRSEAGLTTHSGLLTLDFDHVTDLQELKAALLNDDYLETVLLFTSPSGDGLKWIVEIDLEEDSHLNWFKAIDAYVNSTYHMEIDGSGKDVSRCCFLPWDPEVFINPKYIP